MTIMKNITALKAWRRHRIAVIVSVASLCLPRCLGAGEGGKLILNGIGLIVQVSSQISTGWFGAETSTITGLLKSYTFTEIGNGVHAALRNRGSGVGRGGAVEGLQRAGFCGVCGRVGADINPLAGHIIC